MRLSEKRVIITLKQEKFQGRCRCIKADGTDFNLSDDVGLRMGLEEGTVQIPNDLKRNVTEGITA